MNNLLYFTTDVVNPSGSLSLVKTSFLTAAVFAAFILRFCPVTERSKSSCFISSIRNCS